MKSKKTIVIVCVVVFVVIAVIGASSNSKKGSNNNPVSGSIPGTNNTVNNSVSFPTYTYDSYDTPAQTNAYSYKEQTTEEPQQTAYYNSSMGPSAPGFVSFNTPGNAGLNVRSAPSSDSVLLTTLPEGEKLFYFPESIQNGYIYCELSGRIGGIIYGWLLAEYVMVE